MKMLTISLKDHVVTVIVRDGDAEIDRAVWRDDHTLTERLLPEIDALLAKNGLTPAEIADVAVQTDASPTHTAPRIARTVATMFQVAKFA